MALNEFCEKDKRAFDKLRNFQLSNSLKKIGWAIVLIAFALMIAKKFFDEPIWVKPLLRNIMLVGLLVVSFSKEKVEDEMVKHFRSISYRLAFLLGVLYAIVHPYVDYAVELAIISEKAEIEMSYFQVFLFMFMIQIAFFEVMKRRGS